MEPEGVTRALVMSDVAARAGVSHQTVSRVVNGHPHVAPATRELVGVDVFVESERDPRAISITLQAAAEDSAFDLTMISSRGAQVWPEVAGHTFLVDHFRARFMFKEAPKGNGVAEITDLLQRIGRQHNWMHIEKLQRFDGADAYSKA